MKHTQKDSPWREMPKTIWGEQSFKKKMLDPQ